MKLVAPFMALLIVLQFWTSMAHAQDTAQMIPDGTTGNYFAVPKNDSVVQTKNLPANEFDGRYSTFKIGLGLIYDFTTYAQSDEFKRQMDTGGFNIDPHGQLRDFRVIGSGRLKSKRPISWKFAYMWDGDAKTWLVRESGVIVGVPELKGNIFVGRTKEGFSMIKVMNGHSGVTMERQMALDPIPIISDGIKYYGFLPKA